MKTIELGDLAVGSPPQVASACLEQIGIGNQPKALRTIKPGRHFVCNRLVVDKAAVMGSGNRLLEQRRGVAMPPFDASYLRGDKCMAPLKILRVVLGPYPMPLKLFSKQAGIALLLVDGSLRVQRCQGQGKVEVVGRIHQDSLVAIAGFT